MSRTSWLLSLIVFTITGDSLAPVKTGLVMAAQDQFQVGRRSFENSEDAAASWRSQNESSWRDGDALPPFLFSQYPGYRLDHQPPGYMVKDDSGQILEELKANQAARRRPDPGLDGPFQEDEPGTGRIKDPSAAYQEVLEARMNEYEMNDEEYLKPRPRKRRPPQNYEFALAVDDGDRRAAIRKASRSRAQGEPQPPPGSRSSGNAVELKSLLKMQQEEGLSLSELLQRRNLSLNDLLKGRAEVISALKAKDLEENDQVPKVSAFELPPGDWTTGGRDHQAQGHVRANAQASLSSDLESEAENASSKNSSGDRSRPEVSLGLETPGSSTTSVPSSSSTSTPLTLRPQARDSMESGRDEPRPESLDDDEIMEFSDFTEFKKGKSSVSQAWLALGTEEATGDAGSTLSIEQILQPTEKSSTEDLDVVRLTSDLEQELKTDNGSPLKIDNESPLKTVATQDYNGGLEQDYQDDAPLVQPKNEESKVESVGATERSNLELKEDTPEDGVTTLKVTTKEDLVREDKQYEGIVSEVEPEARAEIFELFASGSAGKRLEKLLKSRNMSLEELIDLRQRGSSKVHLAEVSRLKVQKPETGRQVDQLDPTKETDRPGDRTERVDDQAGEGRTIKQLAPAREIDQIGDTDQTKRVDQPRELDPIEQEIDQIAEGNRTREADQSEGKDPVREVGQTPEIDQPGQVDEVEGRTTRKQTKAKDDDLTRPDKMLLESLFEGGATLTLKDSANDPPIPTAGNLLESPAGLSLGQEVTEVKGGRRVEIEDLLTTFGSLPFTKIIQRELEGDLAPYQITKTLLANGDQPNDPVAVKVEVQSGQVEEVARQEPSSVDLGAILKEELDEQEDTGKVDVRRNLARVRPSIIASGAILGVTIVVFLAIFLACRIRQRQRYRYRNRFPRSVFQGPSLAARKLSNSSSLSTVMVNVVTTSTTKRADNKQQTREPPPHRNEIDNDSLDANDSWETIPDYAK